MFKPLKLSPTQLKKLLTYDRQTGQLTWRERKNLPEWNGKHAGKIAGYTHSEGYVGVGIAGKLYLAHRIAWAIAHNKWPTHQLDHINGNRSDNRLCNLREADYSLNAKNSSKHAKNTSGVSGVSWHAKAKKWHAEVCVDKVKHRLGLFHSLTDAAQVVQDFRRRHGFTERHGT